MTRASVSGETRRASWLGAGLIAGILAFAVVLGLVLGGGGGQPVPQPTGTGTEQPTSGPTAPPPSDPPVEPSPAPTEPPEPDPEPPEPIPPPAGDWPDADSTGPRAGVELRASGSVTADRPGQVVEGLDITGALTITAPDVVVRDVRVRSSSLYPVRVRKGASATIEHVEVAATVDSSIGVFIEGPTTVRHVEVRGAKDSLRIEASGVVLADSWLHSLVRVPGGHHDTVQIRKGVGITITGNRLEPATTTGGQRDPMNAAIQIGSALGDVPVSGLLVEGNYMAGGNYTVNGGSWWVESATYRHNTIDCEAWRYGPRTNTDSGTVWEPNNVCAGTGLPVG